MTKSKTRGKCTGSGGPPGEPFPGFAPRHECPECGLMIAPADSGCLPTHLPATAEEVAHVQSAKANMLFIVFSQGDNWRTVAPFVTPHLDEARRARDSRISDSQSPTIVAGMQFRDLARILTHA